MLGSGYWGQAEKHCLPCRLAANLMKKVHGFSLLELLVAAILAAVLAFVLLNRLSYYREAAEKANVEYTISELKSALRIEMATMLVQGRVHDYELLARQNPMDWLEEKPANYHRPGLKNSAPEIQQAGYWYFDPIEHSLTYWVVHGDYFKPDKSGQKRIRLQVKLVRDESSSALDRNGDKPIVSVHLNAMEPYHWF